MLYRFPVASFAAWLPIWHADDRKIIPVVFIRSHTLPYLTLLGPTPLLTLPCQVLWVRLILEQMDPTLK